jgi:CheY-like chemotaxis protein
MFDPITLHVLVADDDPVIRLLAGAVLRRAGYSVDVATDGADALRRLETGPRVDLVITDLNMPGLDGAELLAAVRRSPAMAAIPVIVMTAAGDAEQRAALVRAGAVACMAKPIDASTFARDIAATMHWD